MNGKGSTLRKGANQKRYREGWEGIKWPSKHAREVVTIESLPGITWEAEPSPKETLDELTRLGQELQPEDYNFRSQDTAKDR